MPGATWVMYSVQPIPICTLNHAESFSELRKPVIKGHVFKDTPWKRVALNKELRTGKCIYCELERYQMRYLSRSNLVQRLIGYKEKGELLVKHTGLTLPPCKKKEDYQ